MRGIFKEEYGIEPHDIRWRTGGQEEPGRDERTPLKLGGNVDLQSIAAGKTLNKMLIDGELDAVFSARELSCFVNHAPNVSLMFPNYRDVEMEYYKRSGMFPIMHLIGIRKSLSSKQSVLPSQEDCNQRDEGDGSHKGHAALAGGLRTRCDPAYG